MEPDDFELKTPDQFEAIQTKSKLTSKFLMLVGGFVLLFILLFIFIRINTSHKEDVIPEESQTITYSSALQKNMDGSDPKALQDFLVTQIKNNVNDDKTKSAIYWITHRYFDNGGNINEIYDFIESHPEVAFLKEAERLYPDIFADIKTHTETHYSRNSLIALLSYYEVIDANGYANLAIWGLAANKYAEQAFLNSPNITDSSERAIERAEYRDRMLKSAQYFVNASEAYIINNTMRTGNLDDLISSDIQINDLLVGLNQYASALAYLIGMGHTEPSAFSIKEIFEFSSQLAQDKVPSLYFFTNYLYATALVQTGNVTFEDVSVPLGRVIDYANDNPQLINTGSLGRLVNAKNGSEVSVFSHDNAIKLANLDPNFKSWLQQNGWQDKDF